MARYTEKFVLHIPHFKWDGELKPVDYELFRQRTVAALSEIGMDSFYTVPGTGYYRGRGYEEELLVVFCGIDAVDDVAQVFQRVYVENNMLMCQEEFAYEHNGILYVEMLPK